MKVNSVQKNPGFGISRNLAVKITNKRRDAYQEAMDAYIKERLYTLPINPENLRIATIKYEGKKHLFNRAFGFMVKKCLSSN